MAAPEIAAEAAAKIVTPKNIKILVITIFIIIVLIVAAKQVKKYQEKQEAEKLVGAAENEIIEDHVTMTTSDFEALANKIFVALDATVSDETAAIQAVASLKTKSDWLSLVSAFGTKDKGLKYFKTPMNLVGWLTDELSDDNKQTINFSLSRFGVQI